MRDAPRAYLMRFFCLSVLALTGLGTFCLVMYAEDLPNRQMWGRGVLWEHVPAQMSVDTALALFFAALFARFKDKRNESLPHVLGTVVLVPIGTVLCGIVLAFASTSPDPSQGSAMAFIRIVPMLFLIELGIFLGGWFLARTYLGTLLKRKIGHH